MKTILRITSFWLCLIIVSCVIPFSASADDKIHKSGIWSYMLDSETMPGTTFAIITGCDKAVNGKIEIPETIAGYPVGMWVYNAFGNLSDYEFVIPKNVPNANLLNYYWQKEETDSSLKDYFFYCQYGLITNVVCLSANKFTVDSGNPYYSSQDGVLFNKNKTFLFKYPICDDSILFELPASVKLIPPYASVLAEYVSHIEDPLFSPAEELMVHLLVYYEGCTPFTGATFKNGGEELEFDHYVSPVGLKVHVSSAQIQEALNEISRFTNDTTEKLQILAYNLEIPFAGASTICTNYSDNTAVELLKQNYWEIRSNEAWKEFALPEVEKCSGHTKTVTVGFNAAGGSVNTSSKTVTVGGTYGTLPTPTRNGYTFDGWFTSASGGTKITSSTRVTNSANHTLYAHWVGTPGADFVTGVYIDDIVIDYKASTRIEPIIEPYDAKGYTIKYESSNPKVATVDGSGKVYGAGKGSAEIKVTITDVLGNTATDTCKVTVKYTFLQWIIVIVLFGWIWY